MQERFCSFRKCRKSFKARTYNHFYCSPQCRADAKNDRLPTMVKRIPKVFECPQCKVIIHMEDIKK